MIQVHLGSSRFVWAAAHVQASAHHDWRASPRRTKEGKDELRFSFPKEHRHDGGGEDRQARGADGTNHRNRIFTTRVKAAHSRRSVLQGESVRGVEGGALLHTVD